MLLLKIKLVKRSLEAAAVSCLLLALPGCQSVTQSASVASVRIIDASPNAPGLDVYEGGSALAYNLGFGTVTSYVSISPGISTISADTAGSKQQLVSARGTFAPSTQYTVLIGNVAASLQETVLTDRSIPAPSGQIAIRVVDQATRFSAGVDVYLVPTGTKLGSVTPVLTNLVFGSNSGYITVPAGTYSIVLLPTGTTVSGTTTGNYTGPATPYSVGAARTFILLDQQVVTDPGFQVVVADDFDSPSVTS